MTYEHLKNKTIAIIGYGSEGQVLLRNFLKHGIKPVLFDHKSYFDLPDYKQKELKALNVNFIFGPDCLKELEGVDIAFKSPGIPLNHLDLQVWIKKGLTITSQTKFFFDNCPAKIIGVTGSQGKGTTTSLIYEILKKNIEKTSSKTNIFSKVYITGNIGKIQPLDLLEELTTKDYIVYELSSFQLQDLHKSPFVAVCLMIKSEHLNYHKTIQEYHEAKSSITKFQNENDIAIFNVDYEATRIIGYLGKGQKFEISSKQKVSKGCYIDQETVYAQNLLGDGTVKVIGLNETQLVGKHNLENIAAAAAATISLKCDLDIVQNSLKNFKGLEHRLEFVGQKNGTKFYNDSVSTSPDTVMAAIDAFSEDTILIVGGGSKKLDYSELVSKIQNTPTIKKVILTGEEGLKIYQSLEKQFLKELQIYKSSSKMDEIFKILKKILKGEKIVLFSPGALSFDAYKNYSERGEQFKKFFKLF